MARDAQVLLGNEFAGNVGREVGPYKIIERLGAGGMGEVYLAQDTRLRRPVALKLLPAYFAADEARARRFQSEARAASALNHPNILTIHEVGEHDGVYFIATEFIDGKTIGELIRERDCRLMRFWIASSRWLRHWRSRMTRASCTATSNRKTSCAVTMV